MKVQCLFQSGNRKKKIVHYSYCHYLKRSPSSQRMLKIKPTRIYRGEYCYCQYCSPVSVKYRGERRLIEDYAREHNQKMTLEHGMLYISNGYSNWLVVPGNFSTSMTLYHKNTLNKLDDPATIDGYHRQIVSIKKISRVLEYIVEHDKYRKKVNAQKREKKHIQELAAEASMAYFKKEGKRKPQRKHYTQKERQVIFADTSDWEAFKALFKPNAAE